MPGVRFSAEQMAKAVRLVAEATPQHESLSAAIESVAAMIGASLETVSRDAARRTPDLRLHGGIRMSPRRGPLPGTARGTSARCRPRNAGCR